MTRTKKRTQANGHGFQKNRIVVTDEKKKQATGDATGVAAIESVAAGEDLVLASLGSRATPEEVAATDAAAAEAAAAAKIAAKKAKEDERKATEAAAWAEMGNMFDHEE